MALVPVAAILVASIRLHFLDVLLHLRYRGPNEIACDAALRKGEEMGWFQHGSTIIVFAPDGLRAGRRHRSGHASAWGRRCLTCRRVERHSRPRHAAHRTLRAMLKTIDLVYFNAGGGHRSAALALQEVIREQGRPWNVRLVNLLEVLDPEHKFRKYTGMAPEDY